MTGQFSNFVIFIIVVVGFYFLIKLNKKLRVQAAEQKRSIRSIICPNVNCGYKGEAKRTPRGSTAVGFILCLFFLLPGILYFMFKSGYRYSCPQCGMQIRVDN